MDLLSGKPGVHPPQPSLKGGGSFVLLDAGASRLLVVLRWLLKVALLQASDTRRRGHHDDYDATVPPDIDRLSLSFRVGRPPPGQVVLRGSRMLRDRPSNRKGSGEDP